MSIIKDVDLALDRLVVQVICAATDEIYIISNPVLDKMLDDIKLMLKDHEEFYRLAAENLTGEKVDQALASCFEDGKMNWGRVVSVLTLLHVYTQQREDCSKCKQQLRKVFTKALQTYAAPWIKTNGGMEDYVKPRRYHLCIYFCIALAIFVVMMSKDADH